MNIFEEHMQHQAVGEKFSPKCGYCNKSMQKKEQDMSDFEGKVEKYYQKVAHTKQSV